MGKKGSETTEREFLSPEDAARVRQGRQYGDLASREALGTQEAGVDPRTMEALGYLQDLYGSYGGFGSDMFGRGSDLLDRGSRTGLTGLDEYMNPYIMAQLDPMRAMFGDMRADKYMQAGQEATGAGAYGGSRHAMLARGRLADVDQMQAQYEGGVWNQGARDAAGWMLGERGRAGQMGLSMMDRYMRALQAQQGAAGGIAGMGDYLRNIEQLRNERAAKNAANAAQLQMGTYGQDISKTRTTKEEKGWAEGILPTALNVASMFIPGGQAAGAAGMFSQLFGGGPGGYEGQMSNFGSQYAADPWQGMNMGNLYQTPPGGYGALFDPVPAGGFFNDVSW